MTTTLSARADRAPAPGVSPGRNRALAAQQRFPARTVPASWPGTERSRAEAARLLSRPPYTLEKAGSELHHKHGIVMVLDWLDEVTPAVWTL